jgi:hypothetical protein
MDTNELAKNVKRLRDLDTKRSPGIWEVAACTHMVSLSIKSRVDNKNEYIAEISNLGVDKWQDERFQEVEANADFLAAAPDAVQTINALVELVGEMQQAMNNTKNGSDGISMKAIGAYRNVTAKAAPIAALAKEEK